MRVATKVFQTRIQHMPPSLNYQVRVARLSAEYVAHGLRKARGRQPAESGGREKEIIAVIGGRDPRVAAIHMAAADPKRPAEATAAKLRGERAHKHWRTLPKGSPALRATCRG
jgi:hypothetical protein